MTFEDLYFDLIRKGQRASPCRGLPCTQAGGHSYPRQTQGGQRNLKKCRSNDITKEVNDMAKDEYDAIILGGGSKGLTAAAFLVKAGVKV